MQDRSGLQAICDLLREQITTVGNAAVKSYGGKIRAIHAFLLGPGCHARNRGARHAAEKIQQAIVRSYRANFALVVASFRTQADQLNQSAEIFRAETSVLNAGDFPHAV